MAWDLGWAATKASEAMRYLAAFYPECSGSEVLHGHQDAAHQAAVSEALRAYMRAGRDEALRIRKEAA